MPSIVGKTDTEHMVALLVVALTAVLLLARVGLPTVR